MSILSFIPKELGAAKALIKDKLLGAPVKGLVFKGLKFLAGRFIDSAKDSRDLKCAVMLAAGVVGLAKNHVDSPATAAVLEEVFLWLEATHTRLGEPS